ncbi:recombinase family protein [Komagataeibacter sucrofermentans]|uniref:Resolvase n=1 Tax=Komagataeibacter sucrofermentans TaxID=1053551 RepID=A0A318QZV6_9PROT|nr:recombinase family protein [Komagataeibacter sucrofermentans]PYD78673.1 resolvase [Komagataeibacter sucrofermentans]GBQ53289.1 DNA resolvase [Komagataeibacter sucrofermentans DSM 15973]
MLVGYARVSTDEQTLDVQLEHLHKAGCNFIFEEKMSGAERQRPALNRMLKKVKAGDVVIIHKLDRLARSTKHLLEIAEHLQKKQTGLRSISEPWADTTSPAGRMILTIFAGIAEFERAQIRERTAAGRRLARQRGVQMGRPTKLTHDDTTLVCQLVMKEGLSVAHVARRFGVHKATVYRILNRHQQTPA